MIIITSVSCVYSLFCSSMYWLFNGETDESESTGAGDVKSRLKKKAVSGLQRKDSKYCRRFQCVALRVRLCYL